MFRKTARKKELLKQFSDSTDCAMVPEEDTTDRPQICDTKDAEEQKTSPSKLNLEETPQTPKVESSLPPHKMDVFDESTAKSRKQRRRRSRGKPLSNYSDIAVARKLKRSSVSIRTEFPCASAIVTARERIKFKDGRPNNYQMCR